MVLASFASHALGAHEGLSRSDAMSGFLEVVHRLFEDRVFVNHDQSIRVGIPRSLDCFAFSPARVLLVKGRIKGCKFRVNNRENPFMFRDAMLKLILAQTLPYAKLIED